MPLEFHIPLRMKVDPADLDDDEYLATIGWIKEHGGAASVTVSDTEPTNPKDGDLWFDSDLLAMQIWLDDPPPGDWHSVGGGGASVTVSDTQPTDPIDGALWWQETDRQLQIWSEADDEWHSVVPEPAATRYTAVIDGDGTATDFEVEHELGTSDISVSIRNVGTNNVVWADWTIDDDDTITVEFAEPPPVGQQYSVVVLS